MPQRLNSFRLWALVALIIVALSAGSVLRAMQQHSAPMTHWPQLGAI